MTIIGYLATILMVISLHIIIILRVIEYRRNKHNKQALMNFLKMPDHEMFIHLKKLSEKADKAWENTK
jgi:hypothetical protein